MDAAVGEVMIFLVGEQWIPEYLKSTPAVLEDCYEACALNDEHEGLLGVPE